MNFEVELALKVNFDSAHFMPTFPEGHPNRRIHGHSYVAELFFVGPVDPVSGYLYEADELKEKVEKTVKALDHVLLNDVPNLGLPTSENIARYLFLEIKKSYASIRKVAIHRPQLGLTVSYNGKEF